MAKNVNMIGLPVSTSVLKDILDCNIIEIIDGGGEDYPYLLVQKPNTSSRYRIYGVVDGEYEELVTEDINMSYFFNTLYLNGYFYAQYYGGALYRSSPYGTWSLVCTEYLQTGGNQQWQNYPDSPFSKEQFPKQVISWFGNDEFPASYTRLSMCTSTNDQYGPRLGNGGTGDGLYCAMTTYIYRLVSGAWVYETTRYNGQYIDLVGPLLPSPSSLYIKECNYNIRDYNNPSIISKAKTTTLEQDNLADTPSTFNNIVSFNGRIYITATDDLDIPTLYEYAPNLDSFWNPIATTSITYRDDLFSCTNGLYTSIEGIWNRFNFNTVSWDIITGAYCSSYTKLVEQDIDALVYMSTVFDMEENSYHLELYSIVSDVVSEPITFHAEIGEPKVFNLKLYYVTQSMLYEIVGDTMNPIISLDQKDTTSTYTYAKSFPCLIDGELGLASSYNDDTSSLVSIDNISSTSSGKRINI